MNEYTEEEFNAAMKTSREYSTGVTIAEICIKEYGPKEFIHRIIYPYQSASHTMTIIKLENRLMETGKNNSRNCMNYVRDIKDAEDHLIAALHEGLINCVDGKFTINKETIK